MTRDEITKRFETFFEWDTDDRSIVTSTSAKLFAEHIAGLAVAAEREMCARICDEHDNGRHANYASLCADAIRARGAQ